LISPAGAFIGALRAHRHPGTLIYKVTREDGFHPGTIYTEAPSDSSIPGLVGTIDPTSGQITPVITGLGSPTGISFLPF
jgi:hypothetical protein